MRFEGVNRMGRYTGVGTDASCSSPFCIRQSAVHRDGSADRSLQGSKVPGSAQQTVYGSASSTEPFGVTELAAQEPVLTGGS